ncbi:DUF1203 domain-containing protein [Ruegeria sp. WL0004]|uniref:DUF1203 domain-containing protein n=1 Tax=Ruegeria marisflavi TaxID=2984152 RepID=A0ABT2WYP9_9RHOB|nr:DUF1203 domain-containing protein [Ruegeria sp. WL0004]MCU9840372.1 DUF1203 domain-containing protein [Ruegeria sp. WL0004]
MIRITALPTDEVRALQSGQPDAYGNRPERAVSDGVGNPCRHCLRQIPEGADMLILAHRPFAALHPYAETGPIFLCAAPCTRHVDDGTLPEVLTSSPDYLIKGYGRNHRIVYGTGQVVPTTALMTAAEAILLRADVAYVHVRSARNNCYQARLDRA